MSVPAADTSAETTLDSVGMVVPPPFLFGGPLLLGLLLQRLFPFGAVPRGPARILGAALAIAGLGLGVASDREMRLAGTSSTPTEPTTALVTSGPYRFSRNPIYASMTLLYLGISAIANAVWPLLLLPGALLGLTRLQIEREERYLERRFGESYRRYKESVQRWL